MTITAQIQKEELESKRYKTISNYLINNVYDRKHYDLEKRVYDIVDTSSISYPSEYELRVDMINRYYALKELFKSIPRYVIYENEYLKKAYQFFESSVLDSLEIINILKDEISADDSKVVLRTLIPSETDERIPRTVNEEVRAIFDGNIFEYVNCLDEAHEHIYSDYNEYVSKCDLLLEKIYLIELNKLLNDLCPSYVCYNFSVYTQSGLSEFISSFQKVERYRDKVVRSRFKKGE